MQLFISYAHKDEKLVKELVSVLSDGGHTPWFDHQLLPGDDWKAVLRAAIEDCDGLVYAMSADSLSSEWCQWEFATAVELGRPIIPVRLAKGITAPDTLRKYQYADFSEGATAQSVARLMGGLTNVAITIPRDEAPNAPQNPRGAPSQVIGQSQPRWRRFFMPLVVIVLAIGFVGVALALPLLQQPEVFACSLTSVQEYEQASADLYRAGNYEDAARAVTCLLEIDPLNATAFNMRGVVFSAAAEFEPAIADFNRAISLETDYVDAFYNRGTTYRRMGNNDLAIADLTAAIDMGLDDAETPEYRFYFNRGIAYFDMDDYVNAESDFNTTILLNRNFADGHLQLGKTSDALEQFEDALRSYRRYLELAEDSADSDIVQRVAELEAMLENTPEVTAEP